MHLIYQFQTTEDPALLSDALWKHKVAHRITRKNGINELWLLDLEQLALVEQLVTVWKEEPANLQNLRPNITKTDNAVFTQLKAAPMTSLLLLMSFFVAVITQLGADLKIASYFTISHFEINNGRIYFQSLEDVLAKGEVWRLFSPALLHFSVLHIVFNTLWVWDIGRKIERPLGSLWLTIGILVIAISSNVLQYHISGYPVFGGLSGVVYGLIGFAWLLPLLKPSWPRLISKPMMIFFMVWLGVGYTSLPESLGLGSIANTAHTIGLLAGLCLGLLYWLVTAKRKR